MAANDAPRLDRRTFLRALSGSALTLVAGGLTVNLAGCNGAGGNNSPSSLDLGGVVPVPGLGGGTSFSSSGFPAASGSSGSSGSSASSGSSGSSGKSSGSSGSSGTSSGSSGSSSAPLPLARRGFNTRF